MKLKIKVGKGKRSSAPTAVGGCNEAAPQQFAPITSQPLHRCTLFQVRCLFAVCLWAAAASMSPASPKTSTSQHCSLLQCSAGAHDVLQGVTAALLRSELLAEAPAEPEVRHGTCAPCTWHQLMPCHGCSRQLCERLLQHWLRPFACCAAKLDLFCACIVRVQEHAAALQNGLSALACAAADGGLQAVVSALLERRCAGVSQAEAGEAARRVLLDDVLAAAAAAAPHVQQQLLWPLRAILQRQALSRQSCLSGPACSLSLCLCNWLTQRTCRA